MTAVETRVQYAHDNGTMFWPPECDLSGWFDAPAVAQAWEKWGDPEDRRRIMERREALVCDSYLPYKHGNDRQRLQKCGAKLKSWRDAQAHQEEKHRWFNVEKGWVMDPISLSPANTRWVYEFLGFPELWDGAPTGYYNLLDGRDPKVNEWEADVLELGTRVADSLWFCDPLLSS